MCRIESACSWGPFILGPGWPDFGALRKTWWCRQLQKTQEFLVNRRPLLFSVLLAQGCVILGVRAFQVIFVCLANFMDIVGQLPTLVSSSLTGLASFLFYSFNPLNSCLLRIFAQMIPLPGKFLSLRFAWLAHCHWDLWCQAWHHSIHSLHLSPSDMCVCGLLSTSPSRR